MDSSTTEMIENVNDYICETYSLDSEHFYLMVDQKPLRRNIPLSSYNIQHCKVFVTVIDKLNGGINVYLKRSDNLSNINNNMTTPDHSNDGNRANVKKPRLLLYPAFARILLKSTNIDDLPNTLQEYMEHNYFQVSKYQKKFSSDLYDRGLVQLLWEANIANGVKEYDAIDPFYSTCISDYNNKVKLCLESLKKNKSQNMYTFNVTVFRKQPYPIQMKLAVTYSFEARMMGIKHSVCKKCLHCSIRLKLNKNGYCEHCSSKETVSTILPTWTDINQNVHYNVPEELRTLSIAEKLLIQRISPFVPLVHIKNGMLGLRGHTCCFYQDVNSYLPILPRLPDDVQIVKFVRNYKSTEGTDMKKVFLVNKNKVLNALKWLVIHHEDYRKAVQNKELRIDEKRLDWIDGDESYLVIKDPVASNIEKEEEEEDATNLGVSRAQCVAPEYESFVLHQTGAIEPARTNVCSEPQNRLLQSMIKAAKVSALEWPNVSTTAISEYDNIRIYTNAFPWLFPGGVGDITERPTDNGGKQISTGKWARDMLHYYDGRFASDNVWPFFALNQNNRRDNCSSGSFFIKNSISNVPKSVQELINDLENGDTSFISKIMFLNRKVRGTNDWWRYQRSRLYSWINCHVDKGNGPPDVFLTLSCAEHFWPDVIRLLEERIWIADGKILDEYGERLDRNYQLIDLTKKESKKKLHQALIDYTIVVQEFFTERVHDWLENVGKKVLGIQHYWCRFEFASGRGQIHAHILCILNNELKASLHDKIHSKRYNIEDQAKVIGNWCKEHFGLTSSYDEEK